MISSPYSHVVVDEGWPPHHKSFIRAIIDRLPVLGALDALFLSGSLARGTADAQSDLDLVGVVSTVQDDIAAKQWKEAISSFATIIFWNRRPLGGTLLNVITDDWFRCDIVLVPASHFSKQAKDLVSTLYDPANLYSSLPDTLVVPPPDTVALTSLVNEFLRIRGLLVVVVERGEFLTGVAGAGMMSERLKDLLLTDIPPPYRGGALHLTKLLTSDQAAILENLPFPTAAPGEVIAAHVALARTFVPLARARANRIGAAWPTAMEDATRRYLARHLGQSVGYDW